eukprot:TRINITY_DN2794_c0_g1_i1.p1 TRINITY_DN2794_c0_g1~~TRINITY_DN2794_c0_g1_i1.p1  ORF type:complete len:149 (+),score=34.07 TRINITY_DN2794_c0_g1_i1:38-484(+)
MEAQTQQDLAPLHQEETKSEDTTNEEKLSKKQLKRRQKEVERKEYWQKQRKKEKEKRKLKKQKLKEQGLDVRKETSISTQRKRRKESEIEYGGNLVMDASFDTYHNDKVLEKQAISWLGCKESGEPSLPNRGRQSRIAASISHHHHQL